MTFFNLPSLREQLKSLGILAKKSMGQNFLLNEDITDRIVLLARSSTQPIVSGGSQPTLLEIGPGPGGLTRSMLKTGASVVAIERDQRFEPLYESLYQAYPGKLRIIQEDALVLKPQEAIPEGPIQIVANLPYNIGTALLLLWLSDLSRVQSMTLMFQKEVAQRIVASPNSKTYGRLSIICQWLCHCSRLMDVPPGAFVPAPKVTSSVIHLTPRPLSEEALSLFPYVETITRHAFGQRRKMIRSSLKELISESEWLTLEISSDRRAEDLSIDEFIRMAAFLQRRNLGPE